MYRATTAILLNVHTGQTRAGSGGVVSPRGRRG